MITNGWVDWAIVAPGIPDKIYTQKNAGVGLVGHSIVGTYQQALGRFMSEQKDAQGNYTPYAAASVMFILCKNGDLIQMYDIWSSTWTTGGRLANTSYWAIEAEGGPSSNPSEPFTEAQKKTLIRLFMEFEAHTGRQVRRGTTFREHGELAAELGYAPTSCPSHRYDWFTATEDSMTAEELARLERVEALLAGNGILTDPADPGTLLVGEKALQHAAGRGWSAFMGLGQAMQRIAEHEQSPHNGVIQAGPHHHESGPPIPDA